MQLMYQNLARASVLLSRKFYAHLHKSKFSDEDNDFLHFTRKLNLKVVFSVTVQELKKLCLEEYVCKQHLFERFS